MESVLHLHTAQCQPWKDTRSYLKEQDHLPREEATKHVLLNTYWEIHTAVIVHVKNFTQEEKDAIMKYTINYVETSATWKTDHGKIAQKDAELLNTQPPKLDLAMKAKSSEPAETMDSIPEEDTTVTNVQSSLETAKPPAKKARPWRGTNMQKHIKSSKYYYLQ